MGKYQDFSKTKFVSRKENLPVRIGIKPFRIEN